MSDNNKSYRIRTNINTNETIHLNLNLNQDYKNFEILSLNLDSESLYKMYTSEYGCIVGRVLANDALGIPNAKVSVFVKTEESDDIDPILYSLYPYENFLDKNEDNIRYNTLPDEVVSECHQSVGTFPNKRLVLDDENILEIYNKYYKYSTTTNASGDYMIFGVPVGEHVVHVDIDLSDIGELSIRPIDMMQMGYDASQFESPSMFKKSTDLDNLSQIFSQNTSIMVKPFWGNDEDGQVSITRNDISIQYKFEPSCVFIGSLITDSEYVGFSKRCVPSMDQGNMSQLVGKSGVIEMIRKTPNDNVESFIIDGNQLIDGSGVWCYQIPMNLDYVGTDEYGNRVKTNDVNKGVPTRARVRFRMSLHEETSYGDLHSTKVLVPHNPKKIEEIDYAFGSDTKDNDEASLSFRDLFANNVYSVKSYIPRIQKGNGQRTKKFSGIKNITVNNGNNQIPYNNMRVNITFMFVLQCAILKILIWLITTVNKFISTSFWYDLWGIVCSFITVNAATIKKYTTCLTLGDVLCPDMEGWYFAPGCEGVAKRRIKTIGGWLFKKIFGDHGKTLGEAEKTSMTPLQRTAINKTWEDPEGGDEKSIDFLNSDEDEGSCVTNNLDYLMQCVEITLALEHHVIQFDFYNDWLNGTIYLPKWFGNIKRKRNYFFGLIKRPEKILACMEDTFNKTRNFTQQCALTYKEEGGAYIVSMDNGCHRNKRQKCHKRQGRKYVKILGRNGGIVHKEVTSRQDNVYYLRPFEVYNNKNVFLFPTDIILLGSLIQFNKQGIPFVFDGLVSNSYKFPSLLVTTNLQEDGQVFGACANENKKQAKVDTKGVEPTFAQDEDSYDGMEYMVSEMSGVDWGYSGPSQGSNNFDNLYFPGGHFLGISCFNSETNIKSCVNLSRACEIGTTFSQFDKIPVSYDKDNKDKDGTELIDYKQYQPNGLISKKEIDNSQYRNIFATLNNNSLKTITNTLQEKEYAFTSNFSFNFDGALSTKTNNDSYKEAKTLLPMYTGVRVTDENNIVYGTSFEEYDTEYYRFRFGNNRKMSDAYLGRNSDNSVFLPIYNNSFYFYFGIKYGNTSYDKLYDNYFGICENDSSTLPSLSIVSFVGNQICTSHEGYVKLKIDSLSGPYKVYFTYRPEGENLFKQYKISGFTSSDNKMVISPIFKDNKYDKYKESNSTQLGETDYTIGYYREFLFKELLDGDYKFYMATINDSQEYSVSFTIKKPSLTTISKDYADIFENVQTTNFKKGIFVPMERKDGNTGDKGFITIQLSGADFREIFVTHEKDNGDGTITITRICTSIEENNTGLPGYFTQDDIDSISMYKFYVPSGDTSYYLNFVYNCPDEKTLGYKPQVETVILKSDISYTVLYGKELEDYFFTNPIMSGRILRKALTGNIAPDSIYGRKGWYVDGNLSLIPYNGNEDVYNMDGLSPERFACLEQSIIYDKSLFSNIRMGSDIIPDMINLGVSNINTSEEEKDILRLTGDTVTIKSTTVIIDNNQITNISIKQPSLNVENLPILLPTSVIKSETYYLMDTGFYFYVTKNGECERTVGILDVNGVEYDSCTYSANLETTEYYFVHDIAYSYTYTSDKLAFVTFFIRNNGSKKLKIVIKLQDLQNEGNWFTISVDGNTTKKIEVKGLTPNYEGKEGPNYPYIQVSIRLDGETGNINFSITDIHITTNELFTNGREGNSIKYYTTIKTPKQSNDFSLYFYKLIEQNYDFSNTNVFDYDMEIIDNETEEE